MATDASGAPYRSAPLVRTLTPPPRHVPRRLKLQLLFGGRLAQVASAFLIIGSLVAWIFAPDVDFSSLAHHRVVDVIDGQSLGTTPTSDRIGERPVLETRFRFEVDGKTYEGASYGNERDMPAAGATVKIEIPDADLAQASLVGLRHRPFPFFPLALLMVLFPGAGLAGVVWRVVSGRREIRLLATGRFARGRLVHRERLKVNVNHRAVEKLSFDFEDAAGRVQRAVVRTTEVDQLVDEALEPLVHDPLVPSSAALLDDLPGAPRIDEDGRLGFDASPWSVLAALALPLLALLVNLVGAVLVLG